MIKLQISFSQFEISCINQLTEGILVEFFETAGKKSIEYGWELR